MRVATGVSRRDPAGLGSRTGFGWQLALSFGWMALVVLVYYRQLWSLLASGPDAWSVPELGQGLRHTGLPFAREAALRAASAVGAAAAIVAVFITTGRVIDRWLTPASLTLSERAVVRFANGAGVWYVLFLSLAYLGFYRTPVVRVGLAAAAVLAVAFAARRAPAWFRSHLRDLRRPGFAETAWRLIATAAVATAFVTALAPEIEYDALWYHLELPRRWLAAGRPVDDITEYIALYPLTWQLLYGGALALDGTQAAALLHWTTLVASAVVAASIGTRALGVTSPWLTAAVFVTAPTVLWEATTAYIDLAVTLHLGMGACALWMSPREGDRRWVWLAGIQLGLACASKHLALVPVAIAVALFAVEQARSGRPRHLVRTLGLVSLLAFTLASPWYLRSWVASGNPVFPDLYSVFGARPPERWDDATERALAAFKAHFGGARDVTRLPTLPWDMTMHGARYGGTLGPLGLMFAPGILFLAWRKESGARWLLAGAALYTAVWASPLSSFQLRFIVPLWIFVAPLVALAAERLLDASRRTSPFAGSLMAIVLAAALVLNLPPFTPWHEGDRVGWTGWLTHVIRRVPIEVVTGGIGRDRYLRQEVRTFGAWSYLNERAPPGARVLTFFGGDHLYSHRARLWSEAVVARPVTWGSTDGDVGTLLTRLHALGITHIMAPPARQQTAQQAALTLLQPATLANAFEVVYSDWWVTVYRVRSAPTSDRPTTDQR